MRWNQDANTTGAFLIDDLIYWWFSFKYWVTSIEVPKLMNEVDMEVRGRMSEIKQRFWTETRYKILNAIMIVLSIIAATGAGWTKGLETYYKTVGIPENIKTARKLFQWANTVVLMIAAGFLFDGIRRIRKQFQSDKRFKVNNFTIFLYILLTLFHTGIVIFH